MLKGKLCDAIVLIGTAVLKVPSELTLPSGCADPALPAANIPSKLVASFQDTAKCAIKYPGSVASAKDRSTALCATA